MSDFKPKNVRQKDINSAFSKAAPYLNIGYFFIGGIILFGYLGYKLDQYFQLKYVLFLCGIFLGLALSFYNMFKTLSQLEKKSKDAKKDV